MSRNDTNCSYYGCKNKTYGLSYGELIYKEKRMKKHLTKKLLTVTSAVAIAFSGVNVPNMNNYSYAAEAQKVNVLRKSPGWTFGIYMCGNNLEQEGGSA